MEYIETSFQFRVVEIVRSRDGAWVSKDVIAEFEGGEEAIAGFNAGSRFGRGTIAANQYWFRIIWFLLHDCWSCAWWYEAYGRVESRTGERG